MARKEVPTCDALFYNSTSGRAVHVGISQRIVRALEETLARPDLGKCTTFLYRREPSHDQQRIDFTDVLLLEVSGPGRKFPKEHVI